MNEPRLRRRWRGLWRNALGPRSLLWLPALALVRGAFEPRVPLALLALALVGGLGLQIALYWTSHARFLAGARPLPVLLGAASLLALAAALLWLAVPAWLAVQGGGRLLRYGPSLVGLALALALFVLGGSFARRIGFVRGELVDAAVRHRARRVARALGPFGPQHLEPLGRRLGALAERGASPAAAARAIEDYVRELAVRADPRWRRDLPWASAAPLLESWSSFLAGEPGGATVVAHPLARGERLAGCIVRPAVPALLLEAVARELPRAAHVDLVADEDGSSLVLRLAATGLAADDRERLARLAFPDLLIEELDLALAGGVAFRREHGATQSSFELRYAPAGAASSGAPAPPAPAEPPGTGGLVRRGDAMIKIQHDAPWDPKPTRVEDQFAIMSRLSGTAACFPRVTGYGCRPGQRWLTYEFEPGLPLDRWLAEPRNRRQWFRVLFEIEAVARRLADAGVAHRDLNPGNFVVSDRGHLVLIDFDQAVADAPELFGADWGGVARGTARNDLTSLIERAGLAGWANAAVAALEDCWDRGSAAHRLEIAGHEFAGDDPWELFWRPLAQAIDGFASRRVLEWGAVLPLGAVFAASHGAEAFVVPPRAACAWRATRLAEAARVPLEIVELADRGRAPFDLALNLTQASVAIPPGVLSAGARRLAVIAGDLPALARALAPQGYGQARTLGYAPSLLPIVLFEKTGD